MYLFHVCQHWKKVKKDINSYIDSGQLNIGEPCAPYSIFTYKWMNSELVKEEKIVYGRKLSLDYLRKKLLNKHESYMRLKTDEEIEQMSPSDLSNFVSKFQSVLDTDDDSLKKRLRELQRSRSILFWHDHSSVMSRGYILVTLSVVYDEASFDHSLFDEHKHGMSLQEYVEQPEMYIVCLSSSSTDDQAALIPDRLECLSSLRDPVESSKGVCVKDVIRFFVGDHKAVAFEMGMQCGGHYPCGCCGIHVDENTDQTLSLRRKVRSVKDLQQLATKGVFGVKRNVVKPFENLTVGNLRNELRARGCIDIDLPKPELYSKLKKLLEGCQRVPSLLLSNPNCELELCYLDKYSILPHEPLHDLKGHLNNLLPVVSDLLTNPLKKEVHDLIQTTVYWKDSGHTGADLRVGLLRVYQVLLKAKNTGIHIDGDILKLIESAVYISELLYMPPSERTPRNVLRLYNVCWVHHELCVSLFPSLKGTKFFGLYFHSLLTHAPLQYEIVCLRSVNTESNERLFNSVRMVAEKCTKNPENVIPKVLLHVQAKELEKNLVGSSPGNQEHRVSKEASGVPPFKGSLLKKGFIEKVCASFQAHIERISRFLLPGKGVWWDEVDNGIVFKDGDYDPKFRDEGPQLLHFCDSTLNYVQQSANLAWQQVVQTRVQIPFSECCVRNFEGSHSDFSGDEMSTESEPTNQITSVTDNGSVNMDMEIVSASVQPEVEYDNTDYDITAGDTQTEETPEHAVVDCEVPALHVEPEHEWKTTHGKAVYVLLGISNDLKHFDDVHFALRQKQKNGISLTVSEREKHSTFVALFQTRVSGRVSYL